MVLPFGLCNAPATFQRLMNKVLGPNLDKFCTVYLDDILVFSATPKEHFFHLRWVFERLRAHHLRAKMKKCEFGLSELQYLGHIVSGQGISADPAKVSALKTWPSPENVKDLQTFLGLCNYYAKFIPGYAHIATPLYALLRKNVPWTWSDKHENAKTMLI